MDFLVITKTSGVLGPVAEVLGWIMEALFRFTSMFGIMNIGLCIILFTLVIKLILFPLTLQQQKSSKLMAVMQPEIQAIQKKYKGKTDNESMMKMNVETKAVYEKYGTSMTGGCLQLVIQMPILFALYRVIYNIPAYVSSVKDVFNTVATAIVNQPDFSTKIQTFAETMKMTGDKYDFVGNTNQLIDLLYKFKPANWIDLEAAFPAVSDVISTNSKMIENMNSFLGMNLSTAPWNGFVPSLAWIIPILAGISQWYSTKLMSANQVVDNESPTAQSMKTMTTMMPLMSVVFCFTLPAGIGLYWVASSVFQIIQQMGVNKYLEKVDIDQMIQKNLDKANAKRAKKGLPPQKIQQNAGQTLKKLEEKEKMEEQYLEEKKEKVQEQIKESTEYYNKNAKPGSIAEKAAMVQKYNEKNKK